MGNEDGCHGFVERSAVHVDGGPDWQHEPDDASVDVVVLEEALECDRQGGRAIAKKTFVLCCETHTEGVLIEAEDSHSSRSWSS